MSRGGSASYRPRNSVPEELECWRGEAGDALRCLREVETEGGVVSEFEVEGKGELWPPLTRLKARRTSERVSEREGGRSYGEWVELDHEPCGGVETGKDYGSAKCRVA